MSRKKLNLLFALVLLLLGNGVRAMVVEVDFTPYIGIGTSLYSQRPAQAQTIGHTEFEDLKAFQKNYMHTFDGFFGFRFLPCFGFEFGFGINFGIGSGVRSGFGIDFELSFLSALESALVHASGLASASASTSAPALD